MKIQRESLTLQVLIFETHNSSPDLWLSWWKHPALSRPVWKHQPQGANELLTRAHLDWEGLGCHTHTGSAFCIEVLLCWVHIYLQLLHLPGLILQSICSAIVSCNNLYFQVNFVWISISLILFWFLWNSLFHSITFSLCVSLDGKCFVNSRYMGLFT